MRILIACEYSGRSRRAFEQRGHEVLSCDLEAAEDGAKNHYQGNIFDVVDEGWDLMIAHPPCTYLSVSGMHWTKRGLRDPQLTENALEFVHRLLNANVPRIALENPVSVFSTRIRKPDQIIHPYQFGEDASKATCLWLKNLPLLIPTKFIEPRIVNGKKRWANQTDSGQNKLVPKDDRWKERSRTYSGIAEAWADQWGRIGVLHGRESGNFCQLEKQSSIFHLCGEDCLSERVVNRNEKKI